MKALNNKIFLSVILLALSINISGAIKRDRASTPESLTPSTATLFIKSTNVNKSIELIKFFLKNIASNKDSKMINKWLNDFKNKTDIDPLNPRYLSRIGIYLKKPFAFSYLKKKKNDIKEGTDLYTCPMHPEFVTDDPDSRCSICEMKLKKKK